MVMALLKFRGKLWIDVEFEEGVRMAGEKKHGVTSLGGPTLKPCERKLVAWPPS